MFSFIVDFKVPHLLLIAPFPSLQYCYYRELGMILITACIQTIKCILMSLGRLCIVDLEKLLGYGAIYTIIGGLLVLASPFVIYIQKNREKWKTAREKLMDS